MRAFVVCTIIVAAFAALAAACGDGDTTGTERTPPAGSNVYSGPLVTPVARPPGVPESATAVEETSALGRFERVANAPPAQIDTRVLETASCKNDVIVFETSEETIYAARGCDGFWTDAEAPAFLEKDVAIQLERTDRFFVVIETAEGAQARFTVGGIWTE